MDSEKKTPPIPKPRRLLKKESSNEVQAAPTLPPKPAKFIYQNTFGAEKAISKSKIEKPESEAPRMPAKPGGRQTFHDLKTHTMEEATKLLTRFRKSAPVEKISFKLGFTPDNVNISTTNVTLNEGGSSNVDVSSFMCNRQKVMDNLKMQGLQITETENEEVGQTEDTNSKEMKDYISNKFVNVERIFIQKLCTWKKNTTYDYLKSTLPKHEIDGYFGLIEELITLHQEYFLPKFSQCYTISEVCDIFVNSETQLKMHLLDQWTKNEELYDSSFAKKIHLTREFYKLPCDQLKIYYKEFIELENSSNLSYDDSSKISRVAALVTKLLSECLNIENVLKFIKDQKIDLKDIGYMLAKEKCYVTILEDGRKKNEQKMEVIFTEKFFILTVYKKPYLNFIEALPLDKIRANFKFPTALVTIIFGEVTRKTYKLTLLNSDTTMNLYHITKDFIADTIVE